MTCVVEFSERYKHYLDRCVSDDPKDLSVGVQDLFGKQFRDSRMVVIERGDGISPNQWYVCFHDGRRNYVRRSDLVVVEGSERTVPKRGKIHMGRTSLMGACSRAIRSGRAFRGR